VTLSKTADGRVTLSWGASCVATDTDFAVYQGPLGNFQSHVPVQCSTGGLTSVTFTPATGSAYYLVVPNDSHYEGRYGATSSGAPIPAGPTRCYPAAATAGCP